MNPNEQPEEYRSKFCNARILGPHGWVYCENNHSPGGVPKGLAQSCLGGSHWVGKSTDFIIYFDDYGVVTATASHSLERVTPRGRYGLRQGGKYTFYNTEKEDSFPFRVVP